MSKPRCWISPLRTIPIVLVLGSLPTLLIGTAMTDAVRERRSRFVDRPDMLLTLDEVHSLSFPDPVHIAMPDERTFRLAHLVGPTAGTPEYTAAVEQLWQPFNWGGNRERGLRTIGTNPNGETLVEMWGFQPSLGGCGNSSWAERRASHVAHWKNLTWQLLSSGLYRLEPGVNDPELVGWQDVAKQEAKGVWGNSAMLREVLDLNQLEQTLERSQSYGNPPSRDERLRAADLLIRADNSTYFPRLLAVVTDENEEDVFIRIRVAQLLEKAGHIEGTSYLMLALQNGGRGLGLDEYSLNSVANEYQTFWNVQTYPATHASVVTHFQKSVLQKAPAP